MFSEMPKGGVKELLRTPDGRKYLARLQKRHEIDLLQPNDPRFARVYGDKIKHQAEQKQQKEINSRLAYEEHLDKKRFEAKGQLGANPIIR